MDATAVTMLAARLPLEQHSAVVTKAECFGMGETVSIIRAEIDPFGLVLVVTHPQRYPSWDELAEARYQLIEDRREMVLFLPPSDRFVTLHPGSFILSEIRRSEPKSKLVGLDGTPLAR